MANKNYTKVDISQLNNLTQKINSVTSKVSTNLSNYKSGLSSIDSSSLLEGVSIEAINSAYNRIMGIYNKFSEYSADVLKEIKEVISETQTIDQEAAQSNEDIIGANPLNFGAGGGAGVGGAGYIGYQEWNNTHEKTEWVTAIHTTGTPTNVTESYQVPEGKTYAKQIESISALSKAKNDDGSYVYKASAIAYGGKDASGKTWDTKTEESTNIRYVEENGQKYYCAAMGTAYGNAGDKVKVTTDTGKTWNVIITDSKSTNDAENVVVNGKTYSQYHNYGSGVKDLCEFNVESFSGAPASVRNAGSYHVLDQFSGNVTKIEKIS